MGASKAVNLRTGTIFANHVDIADTFCQRTRGLLGRAGLKEGQGLFIPQCGAIHTLFMRFSIDVIFLTPKNRINKTVPCLLPFRMALGPCGTRGVLELQCGALEKCDVRKGDTVSFINS